MYLDPVQNTLSQQKSKSISAWKRKWYSQHHYLTTCFQPHSPTPPPTHTNTHFSLTAPFMTSSAPAPSTHLTSFHHFISSSYLLHFLSSHFSQQTLSNSLSCKLGCLSSLISKTGLSPSLLPHYLPIQPTLGLNQACSLCVKNKSSSAHFRVKWDYLTTAFISFLPPFLAPHSLPVVFCGREVRNTSEERVRSC